jgi:hypothetical protein
MATKTKKTENSVDLTAISYQNLAKIAKLQYGIPFLGKSKEDLIKELSKKNDINLDILNTPKPEPKYKAKERENSTNNSAEKPSSPEFVRSAITLTAEELAKDVKNHPSFHIGNKYTKEELALIKEALILRVGYNVGDPVKFPSSGTVFIVAKFSLIKDIDGNIQLYAESENGRDKSSAASLTLATKKDVVLQEVRNKKMDEGKKLQKKLSVRK